MQNVGSIAAIGRPHAVTHRCTGPQPSVIDSVGGHWARTVKEVCARVETYGAGGLFHNLSSRDIGISRTAHARRILFPRQKLMRLLQEYETLDDAELVRRGNVYSEKYKRRFVDGVDAGSQEYLHTKLQLRRKKGRPAKRGLHEVSEEVEGGARETVVMPTGHRLPAVMRFGRASTRFLTVC